MAALEMQSQDQFLKVNQSQILNSFEECLNQVEKLQLSLHFIKKEQSE